MITNLSELKNLETEAMNSLKSLENAVILSATFGNGTIKSVENIIPASKMYDVVLTVDFSGVTKTLYYSYAKKHIEQSAEITVLENVLVSLATVRDEYLAEMSRQNAIKAEEARKLREAEQIEAELKLAERKRAKKINSTLSKLKELKNNKVMLTDNPYIALGWIAKNVSSIHAEIPDFAVEWFDKEFGTDAPRNVVDSTLKTSGGFDMKWNPSFRMSFKNIENAPISVASKLSGKSINNTEFIYTLVTDFGFKFGKSQDYETILAEIPKAHKAEFKVGYES